MKTYGIVEAVRLLEQLVKNDEKQAEVIKAFLKEFRRSMRRIAAVQIVQNLVIIYLLWEIGFR